MLMASGAFMSNAWHKLSLSLTPYFLIISRITFREFEERRQGGDQMIEEAKKIASTFHRLAELPVFEESPCEVLSSMAVVLRTRNTEMVCLDISVRSFLIRVLRSMLSHQGKLDYHKYRQASVAYQQSYLHVE